MRKQLLTKMLLIAASLFMGTSAWADGSKRTLNSQNYESASATDWAGPNVTATLVTGDATYGKYAKGVPSGNGNRSYYKSVSFAYSAGTGYTTTDMTTAGYIIEFDMLMSGGNVKDRSEQQFVVPTTGPNLATNAYYSGTDYIFALSQAKRDAASRVTTWYINDLGNSTGSTVNINYNTWYHYKFVVSATSVEYTISHGATQDATGNKTVTSLPSITGFFGLLGRGSGVIQFDNLDIYDYTAVATANAPTFTLKAVNGANRVYTITNNNTGGTLYYTTAAAEDEPAVGDAAYSSTTDASKDVTFSASGKYYAYAVLGDGTTTSTITEQTVETGEIVLPTPTYSITGLGAGYDKTYTITAPNNVLLTPTVSLSYVFTPDGGAAQAPVNMVGNTISATEAGTYVVTSSAAGYTSSNVTITNNKAYKLVKTIDFGAMTASDFDDKWGTATGAPRDYWTNRAAAIPADVTYYKLKDTSSEKGNPDNSAVLDDITISNYYQRAPQVYIGYGLLTPYDPISGSGNYMNFTVNGATAEDLVVYNGWNNYGSGTFNTVQAGNATFGLYRYDTMLRTIKIYSELKDEFVVVEVSAAGYATYVNATKDLNFSASDIKAYKVKVNSKAVATLTQVDNVPAGTPVLLIKDGGVSENIPVMTDAAAVTGNDLVAGTGAAVATVDGTYTNMILNNVGGKVGFYFAAGQTVAANRAYLHIATTLAPDVATSRMSMVFDGETTGVDATLVNSEKVNSEVYDLQGRRVAQPTKGLYIVNGKKVIIK